MARKIETAEPLGLDASARDEDAVRREAVLLYPTEHVGYDRPVPSNCRCDECYLREARRDAYVAGRLAVLHDPSTTTHERGTLLAEIEGLRDALAEARAARDNAVRDCLALLADLEVAQSDRDAHRAEMERLRATVKPKRETVASEVGYHVRTVIAIHRARLNDPDARASAVEARIGATTDAVLALFPGRTETEVKAEAWDAAVDTLSRHWEDVAPAAVADLECRNPYRKETDRG